MFAWIRLLTACYWTDWQPGLCLVASCSRSPLTGPVLMLVGVITIAGGCCVRVCLTPLSVLSKVGVLSLVLLACAGGLMSWIKKLWLWLNAVEQLGSIKSRICFMSFISHPLSAKFMRLAAAASDVISVFDCNSIPHFWNAEHAYCPALIIPFHFAQLKCLNCEKTVASVVGSLPSFPWALPRVTNKNPSVPTHHGVTF